MRINGNQDLHIAGRTVAHGKGQCDFSGCDIFAERFVARQSRWADGTGNVEAAVSRLRFHAPKLRLGETHVPLGIF